MSETEGLKFNWPYLTYKGFKNDMVIINMATKDTCFNVELPEYVKKVSKSFITEAFDLYVLAEDDESYYLLHIDLDKFKDDDQKKDLRESYEIYRALPSFWEDDSASNVQAFWDYASAIFTYPLTYAGIATGGIASVATKASAYGAVRAGLKTSLQVNRKATLNSALAGVSTDTFANVLTDAEIQGVERRINYREGGYDVGQGALAAAAAIIPGAAIGVTGGLLKKLSKSDEILQNVAEGKHIYLENSEAGKAFLEGRVVEGSFVQVNDKSILKGDAVDRMAYVDSINTSKNTYTVNVGFDELGDAITKEISMDKVKLVDPFDSKVAMKIERQVGESGNKSLDLMKKLNDYLGY